MSQIRFLAFSVFLVCLVNCVGCGPRDELVRYSVSGTVTMPDGTPAPAGDITFEPDSAGGNKGPGSTAQIKDGKFSLPKDQGVIGGKYVVVITPFDGKGNAESMMGKALLRLPYSAKVDFPNENSTQEFKIPKK